MKPTLAFKPAPVVEDKKPVCFRTDVRFLCRKPCPVRKECLKLIAEWRR
ncbi:hypothetical protein [Methylothermus subterraneus]